MRGQFVINIVSSIVLALNPVFVPTASAAPAEQSSTAALPLIDTRVTANAALPDWFTRPATNAATAEAIAPVPATSAAPSEQTAETAVLPAWFTAPAQQAAPLSASAAPRQQPPRAPINSPLSAQIAYLYVTIVTPTNSVSVGNLGGDAYRIYVSNMIGVTNAYTLNVTATLPSGFSLIPDSSLWTFRAADASQHSISHTVFITDNVITWEPTTPLNLLMGEYTDISFKLATSCGVQSAQLLSAFANYSDNEGPGTTASYVNVTTGRGNLVIEQTPSLQDARYGDMVTWTIKARNTGLGNVYSATVEALPDASFTDVNYGSLPFTIGQLAPNEFRSYTVSARVNACSPLRNTAAAYWSCGNVDSTATSTTPVSTSASVKFLLEVPNVSLAVTPNPVRVPYCTNTTPVTVTVNNTGGPALDLILRSNLNSLGASANIVSGSPFTYDAVTGIFSYTGGTPVGLLNRSTSTTLTFNVNQTAACNASNGLLSFAPSFADACDVPFDLPTRNTTYQYGNDAPTLIVTSTAPNSTYAGEQVVFTVLLNAANTQNLADALYITDVVPSVFSVTAASVTTGTLSPIGQTLTWTVSPDGSPVSAILLITTTASSGINQCLSFASSTNVVTATAPVNCAGCNPLISTASSTVIGQNVPGTQYAKTASGSSEVCSDISFTNHYSLSQVTWAGTFFTESLGTGSLVTSLNYISGSLQIMVNGVDRTADVTLAQTAPRLVLDFSGMGAPTETVDFTITYQARVPDAALGGSVYRTYFDWSQLTVGGTVGDESCKADRTFYQGLYLTIYRGDLTVAISPASADACAITPVVLTVSGGRADRVTGNVVVTFTAPADEFASLNVTGFGGAFAGNPVVTTTADNVITWTFANPISSNGTINLTIKRSCSSSGTWRANVSFTDQCGVTYTTATANTPTTYNPNLVLFLTPSRYNLTANVARWRIYLTNNGSGLGTNILVTDTLGAGLQFISYTTSDPTGIALQQNGNQLVWTVATLDPAEQRWIDVSAQAIGCSNLTSVVTATLGCNGSACASQTKNVDFLTFSASLLTSNGQTADLPLCGVGTVVLTTKNTSGGGSAIYNLTLSETLTNLTYVADSAVVTVIDDAGHVVTSTTAFQPIMSTPYVTSTLLVWSHEAAPPGLLDAVSAGYIVSVTFNVATDCAATSANSVAAKVSAASACNQFFQRTENAVTLKVADPIFLFDKLGRGPTQASFSPIAVAEPGETVVWRLHVRNSASGYQAQNVWLTDTLPANFVYGSASPAPTNVAGSVISWDLGDVPADSIDRYYYITGTVSTGSCAIGTTNQAVLEYGCDNGCRLSIPIASATLRSQPSMLLLQTPAALSECGGVITLTVQNLGTTAYTFTLTDTLPAGLIFSETISSSTAYSTAPTLGDTTLAWTFAALPPGDTQIVFVAKNATGACFAANGANQLAATYTDACGSPPNTTIFTPTLDALTSNLVVAVSPGAQVITPGQTISWTITVNNTGDGAANNVVITDVVGSGFNALVAGDGSNGQAPSIVGNQIEYVFPTLEAGATWTAIITGTSITGTQLSYNNVLTASKRCGDGCSQTRTATGFTSPSDRLIKLADPQPNVRVGEPVTYSLSTSFWGEGHIYNAIIISDILPLLNSVAAISVTGAAVTSTNAANTWVAGALTGDTITFTTATGDVLGQDIVTAFVYGVVADTAEAANGRTFMNTGLLTYADLGQSYRLVATTTQTIIEPVLTLSKAVDTSTGSTLNLDGSALITYTLRVTNSGTAPAHSVRLTDAIPSGISVTTQFGGDDVSGPVIGANDMTWLINSLGNTAPDNVIELTYTARISQALADTNLINVVTGTYRSVPEIWPHSRLYGPLTDTRSLSTGDVSVNKSAAPTTLRVGDVTTHSLVFTVPAGLIGLGSGTSNLIDTLPVGLEFVTDTETLTWSPAEVTVITTSRAIDNAGSQQQVTWYFDAITSTLDQPTVITLTLQAQATGKQINTGDTVFTPPSAVFTPTNTVALWQRGVFVGSSTASNRIIQPVLSINKTVTPTVNSFVGSGDLLSYTLVVANSSYGPAYNIVISDVLPADVIYDSSLVDNGTFDQQPMSGDTGTLVWHVATLDGTEVATSPRFTITVYAHVHPDIGANLTLTNSASIPYYDSEPGPGVTTTLGTVQRTYSDGSSSAALRTVNGGLAKAVTFSPGPTATLGTLITYTLTVPDQPISATLYNVQITDTFDPRLTVIEAVTANGVGALITSTEQLITATFTSVPSYTQAYVTVTARVAAELGAVTGDVLTNAAAMLHADGTVTTSNVVSTTIGEPALSLAKSVATSTGATTNLDGNALITYTIRVTNSGTSPAYSIRLTDAIPSGISVTAQFGGDVSSGPVVGTNDLTWLINSIGNTAPDNVIELTYTARITQALANTTLINVVTGTYWSLTETVPQVRSYGPLTDSEGLSTANVNVNKLAAPYTLRVGDVTTYSLVFTVPAGLIGMGSGTSTLIDTLPTGLEFVTDTETLTWSPAEVAVITTSRTTNETGAQQLVTWNFDAITSTLDQPTVVTLMLQAQATGQQINTGGTVFSPASAVYTPTNTVSLWQRGSFVASSTAQNRVIQPVLSINKTVTPTANSYVGSGDLISYTLVVANSSYGPAY
ncbi:MAG: DUF11 domain-containing protein, partial [Thermoflexales bacterium]|nr:DUF11 domain-containing protein [Thermoflexales bacterium]